MKVAIARRYGPPEVVEFEEVPMPQPGLGEVLVKVNASTVNTGDARMRAMDVPAGMALPARLAMGWKALRKPILGYDFAGEVVALGAGVTEFEVGQAVFGNAGFALGAHAEFMVIKADAAILPKPDALSDAEAASLSFGPTTALYFFEKANLRAGEKVLVNGATGAVGAAAVQLAKFMGAEVTAVCSGKNADFARELGAEHVVDYANTDFEELGEKYDVIMDNVGNAHWVRSGRYLKPGGRLLLIVGGLIGQLFSPIPAMLSGKKVVIGVAPGGKGEVQKILEIWEKGGIKPVVGTAFAFSEIVAAHALADTGHKRGSIAVLMKA